MKNKKLKIKTIIQFFVGFGCAVVFYNIFQLRSWPTKVDLKCGQHAVVGKIFDDRTELKIEGLTYFPLTLPLQGIFTDEPTAKYAPKLLPNPDFAMTITSYIGALSDGRKIEFMIYSKDGKTRSHELEVGDEKWQCR